MAIREDLIYLVRLVFAVAGWWTTAYWFNAFERLTRGATPGLQTCEPPCLSRDIVQCMGAVWAHQTRGAHHRNC